MKRIFFIVSIALLLPAFAFAYSYERTSGYTLYNANPVNFTITFDDYNDLISFCGTDDFISLYIGFTHFDSYPYIPHTDGGWYSDEIKIATSTLTYSFNVNFPDSGYDFGLILPIAFAEVGLQCWNGFDNTGGNFIESGNSGDYAIFEVMSGSAPAGGNESFFSLPTNFATGTIAYVSGLFTDLSTPIYIVVGFLLFFLVADWLIPHFTKQSKKSNAQKFFERGGLYSRGAGHPRWEWNKYKKKWE